MAEDRGQGALSVSDAVALAKLNVQKISTVAVMGEVSGWRGPNRTGHCYFSLKDEASAMDVIVWRWTYDALDPSVRDAIGNGQLLLLTGAFDVYERTGRLSFVARHLTVAGEGLLRQRVAQLAKRLQAEGLMDESRRRPVHAFCTRVAVVTSPTGSVIEDVKRTLARRNPLVEILVAPCAVQGDAAPESIVKALDLAASAGPDCILLVRGGGSYEDLMAFNDERVARAVATCPVPVVCGVGHEDDVTICDMVADRRASTPTAAAEGVAPSLTQIVERNDSRAERLNAALDQLTMRLATQVGELGMRAEGAIVSRLGRERAVLDQMGRHGCLTDPRWMVTDRQTALLMSEQRLADALPRLVAACATSTDGLASRLVGVAHRVVAPARTKSEGLASRMVSVGPRVTKAREDALRASAAALDALSPLKVLARGYAIARDSRGHVVTDPGQVGAGDELGIVVAGGRIDAVVTDIGGNAPRA